MTPNERTVTRKQNLVVLLILALMVVAASVAKTQDVREAARKAESDRQTAIEKKRAVEMQIINDKQKLQTEVNRLEAQQNQLENEVTVLHQKIEAGEKQLEQLGATWETKQLETREISGNVRLVARDLEQGLQQSQFDAIYPDRLTGVQRLLDSGYFPGIDDIVMMTNVFLDEIARSGQVGLVEAHYVGRDGEDRTGKILTLGKFTAMYNEANETGFLTYSPEGRKFFALSALPSGRLQRQMKKYFEGSSDMVPIDMSSGAALRQITHEVSLLDQIKSGGPIVWPIGLLALGALVIVVNRTVFLNRIHRNTRKYMTRFNRLAAEGEWEKCEELVLRHKGQHSPVNHVLEVGVRARGEDRETLESVLQEAILREMPRVERGLSVLAILGVVAPLLGLLGTVTGMIDTFRVITLFGTGDPKLMSGGISEALVTTELGLAVAIPIMLLHTLLSRRANNVVGQMERKAVSLVNIIEKERAEQKRSEHGVAA